MTTRRLATLDVGTNTVLLLVVEIDEGGATRTLAERHAITRLGEGALGTRLLQQEPMARTIAAISELNNEVQRLGATWAGAVTTAAARDAENGPLFATMVRAIGVPLEIASGEEEAQLSFYSVLSERPPGSENTLLVMDIGGGSTEFIVGGQDGISSRTSLPIGSVRLTERFVTAHPVSPGELRALREAVRQELAALKRPTDAFTMVGLAGTVTTLCAIDQELATYDSARVQHARLALKNVENILHRLAAMPLAARVQVTGLEEKRADVIVAGAAIVCEAMRHYQVQELFVSDRGVRWGLLWRALRA